MIDESVLVGVRHLGKLFPIRRSLLSSMVSADREFVHAVSDLGLDIRRGEVLGLAGESGCGKSTTGFMLALLERPTRGSIVFEGRDVARLKGRDLKAFRRQVQIVFQDPNESLNPRYTVERALTEPLQIHRIGAGEAERRQMVADALETVELRPARSFVGRYPHELSGGQRQRVALARAIILRPKFLVADEPVSMLDVSVRVGLMNLMLRLQRELGMTYLFITHDLSAARYMCDRIAIMYLGRIVELGAMEDVLAEPLHPYTRLLLSSVPIPDPTVRRKTSLGDFAIPDASAIPAGCSFHPRCSRRMGRCPESVPALQDQGAGRHVACFLYAQPSPSNRKGAEDRCVPTD